MSNAATRSLLRVDPSFLEHLRQLPPIPRRIHVIWPDARVVHSRLDMVTHGLRRLINLNPEWNTTVYTYSDIERYLQATPLLSAAAKAMISQGHIIEKADAFRLLVLYEVPGRATPHCSEARLHHVGYRCRCRCAVRTAH